MKHTLISLLLIGSCTCAVAPKREPLPSRSVRQCFFPIEVRVPTSIPEEKYLAIKRGFEYWDGVTQKNIYKVGRSNRGLKGPASDHLPVSTTTEEVAFCGLTRFNVLMDSCFYKNEIIFNENPACWDDNKVLESVARHESGHALGLNHSTSRFSLMYRAVNRKAVHPIEASAEEKAAVKALVGG